MFFFTLESNKLDVDFSVLDDIVLSRENVVDIFIELLAVDITQITIA